MAAANNYEIIVLAVQNKDGVSLMKNPQTQKGVDEGNYINCGNYYLQWPHYIAVGYIKYGAYFTIGCQHCKEKPFLYVDNGAGLFGHYISLPVDTVAVAFAEQSGTIPARITCFIGQGAFENNATIKNLNLHGIINSNQNPPSYYIHAIQKEAFKNAKSLQHITYITNANTQGNISVCYIGESAFQGCESFNNNNNKFFMDNKESHRWHKDSPNGKIDNYAFDGCSSFDAYTQIRGSTGQDYSGQIGKYAFRNTATSGVLVPGVFPEGCYEGCKNLSAASLIKSTTTLENNLFKNSGLTTFICKKGDDYQFSNFKSIGDSVFEGCNNLQWFGSTQGTLDLSNCPNLETIGNRAFYGCTGITKIIIPNSVKVIGKEAFRGCVGLEEINFLTGGDENELTIGQDAFYGCSNLANINNTWKSGHIPSGNKQILPQRTAFLGQGAFHDCTSLESLAIPTNFLKYVGNSLFKNCKKLETVEFRGFYNTDEDFYAAISEDKINILENGSHPRHEGLFIGCEKLENYIGPYKFLTGYNSKDWNPWTINNLKNITFTDANTDIYLTNDPSTSGRRIVLTEEEVETFAPLDFAEKIRFSGHYPFTFNPGNLFVRKEAECSNLQAIYPASEEATLNKLYERAKEENEEKNFTFIGTKILLEKESLPREFYRKYLHISAENDLSLVFKEKKREDVDKVLFLLYIGDRIQHPVTTLTKIEKLYLSHGVKEIAENVFCKLEQLCFIGDVFHFTYDNWEEIDTNQHSFDELQLIHTTSFYLKDEFREKEEALFRWDTNKEQYYLATTENNILLKYSKKTNKTELNLSEVKIFAQNSLEITEQEQGVLFILPFIGNGKDTYKRGFYSSLSYMVSSNNIKNIKLQNSNNEAIVLQGTSDYPAFGDYELNKLIISVQLDDTVMDIVENNYIFSNKAFEKNGQLIFNNTITTEQKIPNNFMNYIAPNKQTDEQEDWIILNEIDCSGLQLESQIIFGENCFKKVKNQHLILRLPILFQVETGNKTTPSKWFDFSQTHIEQLYYPATLSNFVAYQNSFGTEEQVPFEHVELFYTNENGIYKAISHLQFSDNNVVIPNCLLTNNRFLSSLKLSNIAEIADNAFGLNNTMIELYGNYTGKALEGNALILYNGLYKNDQAKESEVNI